MLLTRDTLKQKDTERQKIKAQEKMYQATWPQIKAEIAM